MSNAPRGKKTLELEGRKESVEVYELTFNEIKSILDMQDLDGSDFGSLLSHFGGKILPLVTNLSLEEVQDLRPSQAKLIWDTAQEVNSVFFDIVNSSGILPYLQEFKNAMLADFLKYVASSFSMGIVASGSTDTPTSSEPSTQL